MTFEEKLEQYARLIARCGVNVEEGQDVVLRCPVESKDFVRLIVKELYKAGAREVIVHWSDDQIARLRYEYAPMEVFETFPQWRVDSQLMYAREHAAFISITGTDPEAFKGVDQSKMAAAGKASEKANKEYYDMMLRSEFKWNVAAVPSEAWAAKVFPDSPKEERMEKLWEAIFHALRIGEGDVVARWEEHGRLLGEKCRLLNEYQFVSLHYENSLGTDFTVGLPENHRWEGGADTSPNGISYFANMPTEEVFTMPHRLKAEGRLVSALPLSYQGNLIRNFTLVFKNGRVEEFTAEEGQEVLQHMLDMDEGARHLGEAALVPYPSPVAEQGILFYNTLFDENASCHFALGACYPTNLEGGAELEEEDLKERGGNLSMNHVDFMIGTRDLSVTGITKDGKKVPVFRNGNWAL